MRRILSDYKMIMEEIKPFKELTDDYFVGNFGSTEATDILLKNCQIKFPDDSNNLVEATIHDGERDLERRQCKTACIPINEFNFIEHGLKKIIENVNNLKWNMDLKNEWESNIQYTRYIGEGHFYNWHQDSYPEETHIGLHRKLTIVYCLSHKTDYEGGEFEVRRSDKSVYTRKFDYGDFIVFPAIRLHRVKPLKSGNRTTIVGWYM